MSIVLFLSSISLLVVSIDELRLAEHPPDRGAFLKSREEAIGAVGGEPGQTGRSHRAVVVVHLDCFFFLRQLTEHQPAGGIHIGGDVEERREEGRRDGHGGGSAAEDVPLQVQMVQMKDGVRLGDGHQAGSKPPEQQLDKAVQRPAAVESPQPDGQLDRFDYDGEKFRQPPVVESPAEAEHLGEVGRVQSQPEALPALHAEEQVPRAEAAVEFHPVFRLEQLVVTVAVGFINQFSKAFCHQLVDLVSESK